MVEAGNSSAGSTATYTYPGSEPFSNGMSQSKMSEPTATISLLMITGTPPKFTKSGPSIYGREPGLSRRVAVRCPFLAAGMVCRRSPGSTSFVLDGTLDLDAPESVGVLRDFAAERLSGG